MMNFLKQNVLNEIIDIKDKIGKNRCICLYVDWLVRSLCHFMAASLLQAPPSLSDLSLAAWIQHLQSPPWISRKTRPFRPCRNPL